jgi:NADPH-dependent 2,4-dienoyl-CoA reductase/sulfur reductase-like enzyme/ferredoxin
MKRPGVVSSPGVTASEADVTVHYETQSVPARAGISIAAALTAAGIRTCRYSAAGDRGLFCGMGVCGECTIEVNGSPGQLACMTYVDDGMRLRCQQAAPLADITKVQGPGPAERVVLADILVVGGGPAGLAAAATAAEAGADVLLADDRASLGGQYYKQPGSSFVIDPAALDQQFAAGRALIQRVRAAGVRVYSGVRVWGADGPGRLYAARGCERFEFRAQRLILATGAYERVAPFPGWTLPGVMTSGAGQSLLRGHQIAPGSRLLVAGNGPLNVQLAAELLRAGGTVAGLVELARVFRPRRAIEALRMAASAPSLARDGISYLATLWRARVPILTGYAVVRVEGDGRAERAVVARLDPAGIAVPGTEISFEVDAVCTGLGFMPGNELARLLGLRHSVDPRSGGYVVERSPDGRSSLENVWVAGDGAEIRGAKVAENAGALAGAEAAASLARLARDLRTVRRHRNRHERFQRALWRAYEAPSLFGQLADPQTIICRCENVPRAAIEATAREVRSAGSLKRLTRAGMGACQGRFCGFVVTELVREASGGPVNARSGFAPQPPLRPTPLWVLAAPDQAIVDGPWQAWDQTMRASRGDDPPDPPRG